MKDIYVRLMLQEAALTLKGKILLPMIFLISCAISNGEFKWEEAGKRTSTSPYMPT